MYLFFDTETTGLPLDWNAPVTLLSNWPRLVQLAYLIYDENEKLVEEKEFIIKPEGFNIPIESSRVHHITTERALAEGWSLVGVLRNFLNTLHCQKYLIAHNMNFDEKIVGAELLRAGLPNALDDKERFCTMVSTVDFCAIPSASMRQQFKYPRLNELYYKLFAEDFSDAHHALTDARVCAKCFFELKRRGIIELPQKDEGVKMEQGSLF